MPLKRLISALSSHTVICLASIAGRNIRSFRLSSHKRRAAVAASESKAFCYWASRECPTRFNQKPYLTVIKNWTHYPGLFPKNQLGNSPRLQGSPPIVRRPRGASRKGPAWATIIQV